MSSYRIFSLAAGLWLAFQAGAAGATELAAPAGILGAAANTFTAVAADGQVTPAGTTTAAISTLVPAPDGNSPAAEVKPTYVENQAWEDFEVHFLVSLPFTVLYSYAVVLSLDCLVQNQTTVEFRQADMWTVIGLAVGASLAIALGSGGRVPDQSRPQPLPDHGNSSEQDSKAPLLARLPLVQIRY